MVGLKKIADVFNINCEYKHNYNFKIKADKITENGNLSKELISQLRNVLPDIINRLKKDLGYKEIRVSRVVFSHGYYMDDFLQNKKTLSISFTYRIIEK